MSRLIKVPMIQSMIIELRGKRVILDSDLAILYQVSTRRLMEQVKRNIKRFPQDFMFQLTREEWAFLKSQIATSERIPEKKRKLPYVFTRNGANMVCTVLRSPIAIQRSIQIMRAFTTLEETFSRKRKKAIQSPKIIQKLSTHSRAVMRLFQETNVNNKATKKVISLQEKMIKLMRQIVIASLGQDD
ncbi:ORF6N domain-containing protein [Candidatus Margulisiibacteriota bacterium]